MAKSSPPKTSLTCPACGYDRIEFLPVDTCRLYYLCPNCNTTLRPTPDDYCIHCSRGEIKCLIKHLEEHDKA